MSHLVIGDIHGCYRELQDLLERSGLTEGDRIVALGDLIDRGPEPAAVLGFFCQHDNALSLLGNHEDKHLRWWRGANEPGISQRITRHLLGDEAHAGACRYLNTFPDRLELPEAYLLHGLWEPGRSFSEQRTEVAVATTEAETEMIARLGERWFDHYDGDRPLVVGHHDYYRTQQPLVVDDRVYCIDTGCCYGGRLTGLLMPAFRFVSVPSRGSYWPGMRARYAHLDQKRTSFNGQE